MAVPNLQPMSANEFLAWVRDRSERYELVAGLPVRMMAGAKQSHAVVASNILVSLGPQAKRGGCRTTASDTAVRTAPDSIRYPDLVVDCGPPDPQALEASAPTILVEVSSPGTSAIDVTDKLEEYQSLPSTRVIIFIDPDVVSVKTYRRASEGDWATERYDDLDQIVPLAEIGATLSLADIYDTLTPEERPRLRVVNATR